MTGVSCSASSPVGRSTTSDALPHPRYLCRVRHDFSLGDELWALYYDRDTDGYVPHFEGTVEAIGYQGVYAGGEWHDGDPLFGSEAEAEGWIREHPFSVPSIKP
jgi:hypothetical protein